MCVCGTILFTQLFSSTQIIIQSRTKLTAVGLFFMSSFLCTRPANKYVVLQIPVVCTTTSAAIHLTFIIIMVDWLNFFRNFPRHYCRENKFDTFHKFSFNIKSNSCCLLTCYWMGAFSELYFLEWPSFLPRDGTTYVYHVYRRKTGHCMVVHC